MKRLLSTIVLIGLAALAAGWWFYARIDRALRKEEAINAVAFRDKMEYLYGKGRKADLLLMGSSRVFHHLDPAVIDSVSGLYSYNLGMDALNMGEMRMMVRVLAAQHRMPRMLVMNIDPSSFMVTRPVFNYTWLLAYASTDTTVYQTMAPIQSEYRWKWKYPFYRFQRLSGQPDAMKLSVMLGRTQADTAGVKREDKNGGNGGNDGNRGNGENDENDGNDRSVANGGNDENDRSVGNVGNGGNDGNDRNEGKDDRSNDRADAYDRSYKRGYVPYPAGFHKTLVAPFNEEWQEEGFELLREVAAICRRERVRLMLVTAPMYTDYRTTFLNADQLLSRVAKLAAEENVPYYNMIDDSLSKRRENFFNFVHLTGSAAKSYSVRVGELVKAYH